MDLKSVVKNEVHYEEEISVERSRNSFVGARS